VVDERPLILIVEDEPHIRGFVRSALEQEGCRVAEAESAAVALEQMATAMPGLIVLDLGLPDRDGVELIRELRTWTSVPVLVLSARSAEGEKIAALDAGADDYLTKPFGVGELRARLRAMLRRHGPLADEPVVEFGDLRVDHLQRSVERAGAPVSHVTHVIYDVQITALATLAAGTQRYNAAIASSNRTCDINRSAVGCQSVHLTAIQIIT